MNMEEYSLWLIPKAAAILRLQGVICNLAHQYKTPVFYPHVTLASPVFGQKERLCEKVSALAEKTAPLVLRALKFDGEDEYYRCFYIALQENAALNQLRSRVLDCWNDLQSQSYKPHISLLYSQPERIEISSLLDIIDRGLLQTYILDTLALYHSSGPPEQWRLVAQYPLSAST